jgi:hypothetical protein
MSVSGAEKRSKQEAEEMNSGEEQLEREEDYSLGIERKRNSCILSLSGRVRWPR